MLSDKSFLVLKRLSQNKQRVAGIKTKTVKNAQDTPIVIIMPKSITGLILLVTKDKNATIVAVSYTHLTLPTMFEV